MAVEAFSLRCLRALYRLAISVSAAVSILSALCGASAASKPAIVIAPSLEALSPSEVDFAVRIDEVENAPPASVVLISGLPADVAFSAGRTVVRGTWEVPLAALAGLKVKIPADVKGRSDLVILLTHNSEKYTVVLASARSALIVDAGPGGSELSANQAAETPKGAEAKKVEQGRKLAEKAGDERRFAEVKRVEEGRRAEEARKAEEQRKLAEEERRIAEAKRVEEARRAEEARKAEEQRKLAEKAEEERRIAEAKRAEEAALAERRLAEARTAPDARRSAEPTSTEAKRAESSHSIAALEQGSGPKQPTLPQARQEHLLAQGDRHLADGNIVIARQYYLRAAQAGMGRAAHRLAETYDPNELRRLNVLGLLPDIAEAKRWYAQAIALGDTAAQVKLGRLEGN